jgi:aspartyl-tRNA(Asn)/glutamyl-tRNA(Gln) amidotransferase subunit B
MEIWKRGSLRCDANVSIRLKGETKLGTKVEVKNLNSIRNVKRAIEIEIDRMIAIVEAGGTITQQTRSFDANNDTTFAIRDKEEANDYRYFAEPDLAPFLLEESFIRSIYDSLPALPNALMEKYQQDLGLSEYDAAQLCHDKENADYFEAAIEHTSNYKAAANWMNGPVRHYLNESKLTIAEFALQPAQLAELIMLVDNGKVGFSVASTKLFHALTEDQHKSALELATELNILQVSDSNELESWVNTAIERMPDKVKEYKKGKKGLIGLFVGEVKKMSKGKADPKKVTALLEEKLK